MQSLIFKVETINLPGGHILAFGLYVGFRFQTNKQTNPKLSSVMRIHYNTLFGGESLPKMKQTLHCFSWKYSKLGLVDGVLTSRVTPHFQCVFENMNLSE